MFLKLKKKKQSYLFTVKQTYLLSNLFIVQFSLLRIWRQFTNHGRIICNSFLGTVLTKYGNNLGLTNLIFMFQVKSFGKWYTIHWRSFFLERWLKIPYFQGKYHRQIPNIGSGLVFKERSFLVDEYSGELKSGVDFLLEPK